MTTRQEIDSRFSPDFINARFEENEIQIAAVKTAIGLTPKTSDEVIAAAKTAASAYPARPAEERHQSLEEATAAVQAPPVEEPIEDPEPEPEPEPDP